MNPDAPWRPTGTPTDVQAAAGRRVLRPRNNADRWARHDADTADAHDEADQIRKGGNR